MTSIFLFLLIVKQQQLQAEKFNRWSLRALPLMMVSVFIDWCALIYSVFSLLK